jgi:general secretion pathway protein J
MGASRPRGFTLVEVLVALLVMAILAGLAWQGLAGILRAREGTAELLDRTLRLNTAVVQWEQDLQSLVDVAVVPPLVFNGQTLVLTRRSEGGVGLVAWAVRGGRWQRWAGPAYTRGVELQEAWLRAQGLLGNEPGQVTAAEGATEWQLYKYLGGRKTNMQSSGDVAQPPAAAASGVPVPAREVLPQAVEMVLTLDGRTLTRLIALGPAGEGT